MLLLLCRVVGAQWTNCLRHLHLIQTGKMNEFPVIIFGKEYWKNLIELIE
jgi:hypothetical protein